MGKIKKIDDDWLEYSKNYLKIKFSSDDNLPLNKPLKFYNMTVTIRCVFSEDNKLYPQVFLENENGNKNDNEIDNENDNDNGNENENK